MCSAHQLHQAVSAGQAASPAHTGDAAAARAARPAHQIKAEPGHAGGDVGAEVCSQEAQPLPCMQQRTGVRSKTPGMAQVPRLQRAVRDRRANWEQSLGALRAAKAAGARVTKTSLMLGCGERAAEVVDAMREIRAAGAHRARAARAAREPRGLLISFLLACAGGGNDLSSCICECTCAHVHVCPAVRVVCFSVRLLWQHAYLIACLCPACKIIVNMNQG